jgi:predicted anti-sigma-YlaC factor YlaD
MKLECPREQDVLDAAAANRWPDRADPSLREHLAGCAICRDVVEIAVAFLEDRDVARTEAQVPPAAMVWWRAQIRAREEAARIAARPIALVQALATVCVAIASLAVAPAASAWLRGLITSLGAADWWSLPATDISFAWVVSAAAYITLPLLIVGIWIVLAPVVVYLALDE